MIDRKCVYCSKSFKVYPYLVKQGYGKYCSLSCRNSGRIAEFPYISNVSRTNIKKAHNATRGENHPSWKGGISMENDKLRRSRIFKEWREKVYKRDNFMCRDCNLKKRDLHPHHIKSFSEFPDYRFDVDNGITLCADCHRMRHREDAKVWGSWAKRGNPKVVSECRKDAPHFEYNG